MKRTHTIITLLLGALLIAGCASPQESADDVTATAAPPAAETPTPSGPRTLKVITHDSFDVSEEVLEAFQKQYNTTVQIIKGGDAGSMLNKVILTKDNPPADVLYGIDNTFLGRALQEGIFEAYDAPALEDIPDDVKLDPKNRAIPVDYGDVCLNYDLPYFKTNALAVPKSLDDLIKPQYRGMLAVENPASSSPGLAFLYATIGYFGEDGYIDFWKALLANDVAIVNDWETAYYTEFTRYGGTRPLVVSYASSPPVEILGADEPVDEPLTAAITDDNTCFRQVEFVGILKGAAQPDLARAWVDFMLSTTFQEDIPGKMYMSPVNPQAKLNEVYEKYLVIPQAPVTLAPAEIAEKRETWIKDWTENILR